MDRNHPVHVSETMANNDDNTPNDKEFNMATAENPDTIDLDLTTPATEAAVSAEDESSFADFLDLDLPTTPKEPQLPAFVVAVLTAIRAIVVGATLASCKAAIDALAAAIEPARSWAEGPNKDAVRTAKEAKLVEIRAIERRLRTEQEQLQAQLRASMNAAPPPSTVEQAIPVVQAAPAPAEPKRLNANYAKIVKGDLRGEWGICVYDGVPKKGDIVLAHRRSGAAQAKQITQVLYTSPYGVVCDGIDFVEPKAPKATKTAKVTTQPTTAPTASTPAPTPLITAAMNEPNLFSQDAPFVTTPPTSNTGTLGEALGAIADEGQDIANAAVIGSQAEGVRRGVGFSSAAGYIQALAQGVKQHTADEYKRILRSQFNMPQVEINALPVVILTDMGNANAPSKLVTHTPTTGKHVGEMTREEARAHLAAHSPAAAAKAKKEAEEAKARELADSLQITAIAGLVASGEGLMVSPGPAQQAVALPHDNLRETLESIGRGDLLPKVKSNKSQFGQIMTEFNGNGLKSWAVTRQAVREKGDKWPADVTSRWVVMQLDGSASLGSAGDKLVVAELHRDDTVTFVGGTEALRARVKSEFVARTNEKTLDTTYLRSWFVSTLHKEFHAIANGGFLLVPGTKEQTTPCAAFIAAVEPLMGRSIGVGEAVNTHSMCGNIVRTLDGDIAKVQKDYDLACKVAGEQARKAAAKEGLDEAGQNKAAERATPSVEVAGRLLKELNAVKVRVEGYAPMLLDKIEPLRVKIRALDETLFKLSGFVELELD